MSRASLGVFAVNLPGRAAAEPPFFIFPIGVKRLVGVALPPLSRGCGGGR